MESTEDMLHAGQTPFPVGLIEVSWTRIDPKAYQALLPLSSASLAAEKKADASVTPSTLTIRVNETMTKITGYSQLELQQRVRRLGTRGLLRYDRRFLRPR